MRNLIKNRSVYFLFFIATISFSMATWLYLLLFPSKRRDLSGFHSGPLEHSSAYTTTIPEIGIARSEPFLFMTLEKLRLKPFQMFILGFMFYYGVTFILNLVQGTAIPT